MADREPRRATGTVTSVFVAALIITCLYVAWEVAVPIAAALLLAFLLTPAVLALERRRVPPTLAVIIVVVLAVSAFAAVAGVIAMQVSALANELPTYRVNIFSKIAEVRGLQRGSTLERLERLAQDVMGQLEQTGDTPPKPLPVVVKPPSALWRLPSLLHALAMTGLVLILLIFMLLRREELRSRLIRLFGYDRLALTTKALDEAGERITAYLVRQAAINSSFGVAIALGLFLLDVPYALLWGVVATFLRFIPYIGTWVAAFLPALLSLAVHPGWTRPLLAIGLIAVLDIVIYMSIEPWFYGHGAGVSEVGLLVGLAFWTWLWGPIGLVLGTPMTVCVVVLAKHVEALAPVAMLVSSDTAVPPPIVFYQRLIARSVYEAERVAHGYLHAHPLEQTFDDLLLPAIVRLNRDHAQGTVDRQDRRFVLEAIETIGRRLSESREAGGGAAEAAATEAAPFPANPVERPKAFGCPAQDEADELALRLLSLLLDTARYEIVVMSSHLLASEVLMAVERERPVAICFGALSADGLRQARYMVKRLRARFPELGIVVGRWGTERDTRAGRDRLVAAGVNHLGQSLQDVRAYLVHLLHAPLSEHPAEPVSRTPVMERAVDA
jgi:predicted PurR-regulated permease PerM